MNLLTATEVAEMHGAAETTIRQLAASRGIGRRIGSRWVFTRAEARRLKPKPRGRPRKKRSPLPRPPQETTNEPT